MLTPKDDATRERSLSRAREVSPNNEDYDAKIPTGASGSRIASTRGSTTPVFEAGIPVTAILEAVRAEAEGTQPGITLGANPTPPGSRRSSPSAKLGDSSGCGSAVAPVKAVSR